MSAFKTIDFGVDKSQILRGLAIIFMITLHNSGLLEFKICVPIFTFLVGYGYFFAKEKNLRHGLKRGWHLLSHFWLILLGLFLPVAIWKGNYHPTVENILLNMFGLESNLNWYSWYVYFYIFAMIIMIPASRLISHRKICGVGIMLVVSALGAVVIHSLPGWSDNIWLQAAFDCFLCSPCLWTGYYLADSGMITRLRLPLDLKTGMIACAVILSLFFFRGLPYATFLDFITVPSFVIAVVVLFNIITYSRIHMLLVALGKQSMNMWFIHAVFATACTCEVFAPLICWIPSSLFLVLIMILTSYMTGRVVSAIYRQL